MSHSTENTGSENSDVVVKKKHISARTVFIYIGRRLRVVGIVVVFIAIGLLVKGYVDAKNDLKKLQNPKITAQNETKQLTATIGKNVELPSGENPTLATVNDATRLKDQEFFKDAQNGDKVLIYSKAGKAILYRPSTKKVIQVAPINLSSSVTQ